VAPEPGQYWIRAESAFHQDLTDGPLSLAGTDTLALAFGLRPLPVELGGLVVEAEQRSTRLALAGYYDRKEAGLGWYLGPERIRARSGRPVSELVALLPGVEMLHDAIFGGKEPIFRRQQFESLRGSASVCYPQVYLNGVLLAMGGSTPGGLDRISLNRVEAVEVYPSASQLPSRFGGAFDRCGTIVLWTR
jgi:hypothetical protein